MMKMEKEELVRLYWVEEMPLREIAKYFGLKKHKMISYYMNKYYTEKRNKHTNNCSFLRLESFSPKVPPGNIPQLPGNIYE